MRLFLASTRLPSSPTGLLRDLLGPSPRAAVIANAVDAHPPAIRREKVRFEIESLARCGIEAIEVDLRDHLGDADRLRSRLAAVDLVWARGGNVFVLGHALRRSGADRVIPALVADDAVAYGGYSAGACVAGPTLEGLELADDPNVVRTLHGEDPDWRGMALVEEAVVPHCDSPDHPAGAILDEVARSHARAGRRHRRLRDGEALVVRGDETFVASTDAT